MYLSDTPSLCVFMMQLGEAEVKDGSDVLVPWCPSPVPDFLDIVVPRFLLHSSSWRSDSSSQENIANMVFALEETVLALLTFQFILTLPAFGQAKK